MRPPRAAKRRSRAEAFLDGLERFAFFPALAAQLDRRGTPLAELRRRGEVRPLLEALLEPGGLGFAAAPKGLIPFHREGALVRTAFEEHLVEAATLARDGEARARTHFTVADEHRVAFQRELERARPRLERELDSVWDVTFSIQSPATDTLAADPRGGPFRGADGRLLFRPAGHGALIGNLAALGADVVWIKNIDNVASAPFKAATYEWARVLIGRVVELEREVRGHAESLARGAAPDAAERFLERAFGVAPEDGDAAVRRERASARLARPLRACGMVRNTGEPGGGPFWVREASGGVSLQIVESAEIDPDDASQREQFAHGTHFNPVLMAVALRDPGGCALAARPVRGRERRDRHAQVVRRPRPPGPRTPGPLERRDGALELGVRRGPARGVQSREDRERPAAPRTPAVSRRASRRLAGARGRTRLRAESRPRIIRPPRAGIPRREGVSDESLELGADRGGRVVHPGRGRVRRLRGVRSRAHRLGVRDRRRDRRCAREPDGRLRRLERAVRALHRRRAPLGARAHALPHDREQRGRGGRRGRAWCCSASSAHAPGQVRVNDEVWRAAVAAGANGPFEPGAVVTVAGVDGVTLQVR